jgi:hypothetical protein
VRITYRLQEPLLSLKRYNEGRPQLRALAAGTLVVVVPSTVSKSGLVDVQVNGESHAVFLIDVSERGQIVESANASSACVCTPEDVLMLHSYR